MGEMNGIWSGVVLVGKSGAILRELALAPTALPHCRSERQLANHALN